ncbi:hypothetical protein BDN72DRAFT_862176 [Pluteus cervinus]|uniref:Uncharacterized protein n=1 Tax=Pluteus cervinus TaxID=181527 RepID=A0ACD3ACE7_9AGAR|nr:hypothetical protein BDN72DRAFT_862176 [Pluteus cervinus]
MPHKSHKSKPKSSESKSATGKVEFRKFVKLEKRFLATHYPAFLAEAEAGDQGDWVIRVVYKEFNKKFPGVEPPAGDERISFQAKMKRFFLNLKRTSGDAPSRVAGPQKETRARSAANLYAQDYPEEVKKIKNTFIASQPATTEPVGTSLPFHTKAKNIGLTADPVVEAKYRALAAEEKAKKSRRPNREEIYKSQSNIKDSIGAALAGFCGWDRGGFGNVGMYLITSYEKEDKTRETFSLAFRTRTPGKKNSSFVPQQEDHDGLCESLNEWLDHQFESRLKSPQDGQSRACSPSTSQLPHHDNTHTASSLPKEDDISISSLGTSGSRLPNTSGVPRSVSSAFPSPERDMSAEEIEELPDPTPSPPPKRTPRKSPRKSPKKAAQEPAFDFSPPQPAIQAAIPPVVYPPPPVALTSMVIDAAPATPKKGKSKAVSRRKTTFAPASVQAQNGVSAVLQPTTTSSHPATTTTSQRTVPQSTTTSSRPAMASQPTTTSQRTGSSTADATGPETHPMSPPPTQPSVESTPPTTTAKKPTPTAKSSKKRPAESEPDQARPKKKVAKAEVTERTSSRINRSGYVNTAIKSRKVKPTPK